MSAYARTIIVGITGASGARYATRLVELLAQADVDIHLTVTAYGRRLLFDELDIKRLDADELTGGRGERLTIYADNDVGAAIASGSFVHDGMILVPASSTTIGAVAAGIGDNLVRRAAAVALKERRRLIVAHRESPLSLIEIENLKRLTTAGAIIAPLSPGFYLRPTTIDDLIDFMVGRLLDLLAVPHDLNMRWEDHLDRERRGKRD